MCSCVISKFLLLNSDVKPATTELKPRKKTKTENHIQFISSLTLAPFLHICLYKTFLKKNNSTSGMFCHKPSSKHFEC